MDPPLSLFRYDGDPCTGSSQQEPRESGGLLFQQGMSPDSAKSRDYWFESHCLLSWLQDAGMRHEGAVERVLLTG